MVAVAPGGAGTTPTAPVQGGGGEAPNAPRSPGVDPQPKQGALAKPSWLAVVGIGAVCCLVGMIMPADKPVKEGDTNGRVR